MCRRRVSALCMLPCDSDGDPGLGQAHSLPGLQAAPGPGVPAWGPVGGGWSARTECCHGMLNGCIQDPASTSRTRAPASESVQSTLSRTLPCCLAADSTRAAGTLSLVQDHDGERLVVVKCRSESSDRPSRMRRARYETPGSLRPAAPGPGSPSRASLFRAAPGSPQAHLDRLHVPRDVLELLRLSLELHPRVRPNVLHAAHLLHARDSGADSGGALFSVGRTGAASSAENSC